MTADYLNEALHPTLVASSPSADCQAGPFFAISSRSRGKKPGVQLHFMTRRQAPDMSASMASLQVTKPVLDPRRQPGRT